MRTAPVIGVVLSLGVAFLLLAGSGIGPAVFGENPEDSDAARTLEDVADDADVGGEGEGGGVSADVAGDNVAAERKPSTGLKRTVRRRTGRTGRSPRDNR